MKRGLIKFALIFLFVILCVTPLMHAEDLITSKVITTEAISQVQAAITLAGVAIYSPEQNSIHRNTSILLNYTILIPGTISLVWYNIDGINISLGNSSSNYTYINTSEGNKTLYLYANNTLGLIVYNAVNFSANNTKLIIIYENFKGIYKGISTDFDLYSDFELENFTNMTLENTRYGKILWRDNVNLSDDILPEDRTTTLDNYVVIANKSIYLNKTELPNLDKNATLWFYNLSFTTPRVLIDGILCPANICTNGNYAGGILRFDVTGFYNFTVEETPTQPQPPGGGGGPGG